MHITPRAGRDLFHVGTESARSVFQSTRPVRGATSDRPSKSIRPDVSIHAPRAGRDTRPSDPP
nr:MAG TPA: hypothetical protein [Caudoviricetes sp.]